MKRTALLTLLVLPLISAGLCVPAFADVAFVPPIVTVAGAIFLVLAIVIITVAVIIGVIRKRHRGKDEKH